LTITVHHLNNSRSQRVLWLLEELQVSYEITKHQRDPKTMAAPPSLRAVHPLGKAPVIEDDDRVVAESANILEYILERHGDGRLQPQEGDEDARLRYRQFMHYAEGGLMPIMLLALVFAELEKAPVPFFLKPVLRGVAGQVKKRFIAPQTGLHLRYLDAELARRTWFAGEELTAADIQMSFPIEAAATRSGEFDRKYPHLRAFLDRVHARPAFRRAEERGGGFLSGDSFQT